LFEDVSALHQDFADRGIASQNMHASPGSPTRGIRHGEDGDHGSADGGRQVRDAGIIADEEVAAREDRSQMGDGQGRQSKEAPERIHSGPLLRGDQALDQIGIGWTFDEEERAIRLLKRPDHMSEALNGPALAPTSAPRVHGDELRWRIRLHFEIKTAQPLFGSLVVFGKERQTRRSVFGLGVDP